MLSCDVGGPRVCDDKGETAHLGMTRGAQFVMKGRGKVGLFPMTPSPLRHYKALSFSLLQRFLFSSL